MQFFCDELPLAPLLAAPSFLNVPRLTRPSIPIEESCPIVGLHGLSCSYISSSEIISISSRRRNYQQVASSTLKLKTMAASSWRLALCLPCRFNLDDTIVSRQKRNFFPIQGTAWILRDAKKLRIPVKYWSFVLLRIFSCDGSISRNQRVNRGIFSFIRL